MILHTSGYHEHGDFEQASNSDSVLSRVGWLNDKIIAAAQSLIRKDFPSMGGLQQPVLQETSSFEASKVNFFMFVVTTGV